MKLILIQIVWLSLFFLLPALLHHSILVVLGFALYTPIAIIVLFLPTMYHYWKNGKKEICFPQTEETRKRQLDLVKRNAQNKGTAFKIILDSLQEEQAFLIDKRHEYLKNLRKELGMEDEYWETADGRVFLISDMETNHIKSSINALEKMNNKNIMALSELRNDSKYKALINELKKRDVK